MDVSPVLVADLQAPEALYSLTHPPNGTGMLRAPDEVHSSPYLNMRMYFIVLGKGFLLKLFQGFGSGEMAPFR